ncbi:DUF2497 domain-containing protein [Stappia sp. F7233]|uniref:DUF2497 domain-containing protein n=1 Tax=Stappia albiluteola TaxID=2758565 RepID=A0A839ACR9_9HYPH|nr:DUF2497 domain-containing protein [Stappia albiluteola]MBA5776459.1 DUF2497 domain-containing protein [Stappia albiluteola]
MANPKSAQEPSMEEILASIRRIISDDDAPPAEPAVEEETDMDAGASMSQDDLDKLFDSDGGSDIEIEAPEEDDDVLELTEELAVEDDDADAGDFDMVNGFDKQESELAFVEPDEEPDMAGFDVAMDEEEDETEDMDLAAMVADQVSDEVSEEAERLLSPTTDNAVHSAFSDLASTILTKNARTLEDLVKEMLRPMLKAWLDQNLPTMVERLVRQEIERISRGR